MMWFFDRIKCFIKQWFPWWDGSETHRERDVDETDSSDSSLSDADSPAEHEREELSSEGKGDQTLTDQDKKRILDILRMQPTKNAELQEEWGMESGEEVYNYMSSNIDDYYHRDENHKIRATERVREILDDIETDDEQYSVSEPSELEDKTALDVSIGLDFGTSNMKCYVRTTEGERRYRNQFPISISDQLHFPSVVWIKNNKLGVGSPPDDADEVIRAAKACLRCSFITYDRCGECFENREISPEFVFWLVLSYCVSDIKKQIKEKYPPRKYEYDKDWMEWKTGVPISDRSDGSFKHKTRNLLWQAVHHGVDFNGDRTVERSEAREAFREASTEEWPGEAEANCFIVPEAFAAVQAFLHQDRNIEKGKYYMADVGASTTDIAFFWYSPKADPNVNFYTFSSTRAGANHIYRRLARTDEFSDYSPQEMEAKIRESPDLLSGNIRAIESVFDQMLEGRREAFGQACQKEDSLNRWTDLRCMVFGGGSFLPEVKSKLSQYFSHISHAQKINPKRIRFDITPEGSTQDLPLHGAAAGLSVSQLRYREYLEPDSVPAVTMPETERYTPHPDGGPRDKSNV